MINQNLNKIEKLINSELSSKISSSEIKFEELLFKTSVSEITEVIKFLKLDNRFKFKQLIDIAAIDYPNEEKRFELVYLLLSIENNARVKISIKNVCQTKIIEWFMGGIEINIAIVMWINIWITQFLWLPH